MTDTTTDTTTDAASAHASAEARAATAAATETATAPATETVTAPAAATEGATAQLPGYHDTKAAHLARLRRIEGQVRGIAKMIEEDKYCIDVLTQISAVNSALQSVALGLLDEHLGHCVAQAVAEGGEQGDVKLAEASAAIARLVRS